MGIEAKGTGGEGRGSRVYRWLLRLLPESFRSRYGSEILEVLDRQEEEARREGGAAVLALHVRSLGGLVRTALQLHLRGLGQDLRFALRSISRHPLHAVAVVGTLTLGIGATTAVYGVVRSVLLRPLPYPDAHELVMIKRIGPRDPAPSRSPNPSFDDYRTLDDMEGLFSSVTAVSARGRTLEGGGIPEWVLTAVVTREALETLGLPPARGRAFAPDDEAAVILTHDVWLRAFAGDDDVVGGTVRVDGSPHTVVGVLAPGAGFLDGVVRNPFGMLQVEADRAGVPMGSPWVVGRLRPDVSREDAAMRLAALAAGNGTGAGGSAEATLTPVPLKELVVGPSAETALWLLLGAAILVLAIAGVNVANLRLTRAGEREREIAVRCALGAGWTQLGRLFSMEALVLAGAGALGGLALSAGLTALLRGLSPRSLPRLAELGLDWTAVAAAGGLAMVLTVLLALVPLARWWRRDLRTSIRVGEGARPGALLLGGRLFVITQVAATVALTAGTVLITRSFWDMYRQDLGYDSNRVLNVFVSLDPQRYPGPDEQLAFQRQLQDGLEALPEVTAAAAVNFPLGEGAGQATRVADGTRPPAEGEGVVAGLRVVSPGFFRAAGIPLVAGAEFRFGEGRDSLAAYVVTRDLAEALWPGGGALGRTLTPTGRETGTVVGVTEPVRFSLTRGRPVPAVFASYTRTPSPYFNVMVRTRGEPLDQFQAVRRVTAEIDPSQAVHLPPTMETLDRRLAGSVADRWLVFLFVGGFSTIAVVLSSLGLYGLLAARVRRRKRDIGVRLALGASPGVVYRGLLGEGLLLTAVGIALGSGASLLLNRPLERFLFGVTPTDPASLGATALLLLAIAGAACTLPARRAAQVDPARTIREE